VTNGTNPDGTIPTGSLGMNWDENTKSYDFPFGMQWMYPCGGMPMSENRTKWPVTGGAIAFQPGWFNGHKTAFVYINIGLGTEPQNYSHPMVPVFQLTGPTNLMYPGTYCLPQVPLPLNITYNVGDNATLQIVETAVHGAALYSCVDITFAEPEDVAQVNSTNCFNSTGGSQGGPMGMNFVFTATGLSSSASTMLFSWTSIAVLVSASIFASLL